MAFTEQQIDELLVKLEGLIGALKPLEGIEKALEKLAADKKPPSSKRGKS